MNRQFSKTVNSFSRLLSNELLALRIYQYWVLGAVLILGVFGIYPSTKAIFQKVSLIHEMSRINRDLSLKATELSELGCTLEEVKDDAFFLQNYMPDNFNIQNYMVDFVVSAAQSGFLVDRFSPIERDKNITEVSVILSGEGNPATFVRLLENMERITEVSQLVYTVEQNGSRLRMIVKIYSMQK